MSQRSQGCSLPNFSSEIMLVFETMMVSMHVHVHVHMHMYMLCMCMCAIQELISFQSRHASSLFPVIVST